MGKMLVKSYAKLGMCLSFVCPVFLIFVVTYISAREAGEDCDYFSILLSIIAEILLASSWWIYFHRIWKSEKFSIWLLDPNSLHGKFFSPIYAISNIFMSLICIWVMNSPSKYRCVNIDTYGECYDFVRDEGYEFSRFFFYIFLPLVLVPIVQLYLYTKKKKDDNQHDLES